jgi:glycosyltransferase involved in cell wall biosynthesis
MNLLRNPAWLRDHQFGYQRFADMPPALFDRLNEQLDRVQSRPDGPEPLVSIVIPAYNEEANLLSCVSSLASQQTTLAFEIIVVNNNSTDQTQAILDRLHLKSYFQPRQGVGPARQMGQENAAGRYILLGDSDCIYPAGWLNALMAKLQRPGVVCVYGRYAFMAEPGFPRWKLALLEQLKNGIAEFRHLNRPYFNSLGLSMGYVKEYGLKVGFVMTNFWGEDGRLCLDLMPYGKIEAVRANHARPWTAPRALRRSGSFGQALTERLRKELSRFAANFRPHHPQDLDDPKFSKE